MTNRELEKLQDESRKFHELSKLQNGDIILTTQGKEVEFTGLKRKNFDGIDVETGKAYLYPVPMYDKFVRAGESKATSMEWKELQKGELFYINHKGNALLYRFEKLEKKRNSIVLLGINVVNKIPTSIDTSLYGGKVSDL